MLCTSQVVQGSNPHAHRNASAHRRELSLSSPGCPQSASSVSLRSEPLSGCLQPRAGLGPGGADRPSPEAVASCPLDMQAVAAASTNCFPPAGCSPPGPRVHGRQTGGLAGPPQQREVTTSASHKSQQGGIPHRAVTGSDTRLSAPRIGNSLSNGKLPSAEGGSVLGFRPMGEVEISRKNRTNGRGQGGYDWQTEPPITAASVPSALQLWTVEGGS